MTAMMHEIIEHRNGIQLSFFWRWLGGTKPVGCSSCLDRPATVSVRFEDGYTVAVCWRCKP